jgi:hypothetical protein
MAVAHRASQATLVPSAAQAWALDVPAGVQAGDVLLAFLVAGITTPTIPTPPTGWTIVGSSQISPSNDSRGYLYRRTADGSEAPTVTFTWSAATPYGVGCVLAYSGASGTPDGAAQAAFASSGTPAGPALTPTTDGCMVVAFFGADEAAAAAWTAPAGYAERIDAQEGTQLVTIHAADKLQSTAAAETPTATLAPADEGVAYTIALAPAPPPAPATGRSFAVVIA